MAVENGKCPSCGGALLLDASKEKVVCKFCGHEVIIQQAIQKCVIDGVATFDTILLCAQQAIDVDRDYDAARKKYREALALLPNDYRVLWGLFLCEVNAIDWYARTKGYVQFEGDLYNNYLDAINRYGEKAFTNAPEETKPYYFQIIKKLKDRIQSVPSNSGRKGCYVATCVYGSYDCPQVWTLRRYRDLVLNSTWYGRVFIKLYYKIAPMAVKVFGKMQWINVIWQKKLDKKVEELKNEGYWDTPYYDI